MAQQKLGSVSTTHVIMSPPTLLPQLGLGMSTRNAYVAYNGLESDPPVNMVTIDYLFDFTSLL